MREPTFLVLTALAEEPRHGYAVIEDVSAMTGGRVRLRAGTLYAALDRLRAEGLATETARLRTQAAIAESRLRARRPELGGSPA